jgi:hypothetical protein
VNQRNCDLPLDAGSDYRFPTNHYPPNVATGRFRGSTTKHVLFPEHKVAAQKTLSHAGCEFDLTRLTDVQIESKVWENAKAVSGLFDTVIIDEASQAGTDSVLLLMLAKRIIVVGDNMQNSPEAVGVREDDVATLIHKH